jgi:hypothetical protein
VQNRVVRPDHADTLKLTARVQPNHQGLIVRLLLVAKLDEEQTELIPPWSRFATLQKVSGLPRCAGHYWNASAVNNWYSHEKGFPFA